MTTWWGWVRRRAAASRILLATQLLLVVVTTGVMAGTVGWSDASATTAARAALGSGPEVTSITVRMRQAPDPAVQDAIARSALAEGFAPAPVSITHELVEDTGAGTGFAVWTVTPDVGRILPEHLPLLAQGAEEARRLIIEADVTGRGITHDGDLAPTAAAAAASWSAAAALGFVPLSVLALVTVLGVTQVAGLLAAAREQEVHLMLARGAGGRQLVMAEVAEASAVTVLGTCLGVLGAAAVLSLADATVTAGESVVAGGLATGALIVTTLAATTALQIRRTTRGSVTTDRVRAVAGGAAALVVGAAAAVALWQLWRTGTVVGRDGDGKVATDALAAAAPALLLLTAAVAGLILTGPLTRMLERLLHAAPGLSGPLAGSQVSRRLGVQAVPVVLTILATSTTTLAACFAGSTIMLDREMAQLAAGTDVRVVAPAPASPVTLPAAVPDLTDVDGVSAHAPVWLQDSARLGDIQLSALVGPGTLLADVVEGPRGLSLPELGGTLPPPDSPQALSVPAGTSTLAVTVTGNLFLNPWQQQEFDLIETYAEASTRGPQYEGIPQESLDELARTTATQFWAAAAAPVTIRPHLFLRDLDTGAAVEARGSDLVLRPQVEGLGLDPAAPVFLPGTGQVTSTFALDPGARVVVDSLLLEFPGNSLTYAINARALDVTTTLAGDGEPLLGDATSDWTSSNAIPWHLAGEYLALIDRAEEPLVQVVQEETDGGSWTHIESNEVRIPPLLETSGDAMVHHGSAPTDRTLVRIGPGQQVSADVDWLAVTEDLTTAERPPLRVALTTQAAVNASLTVGDRFELAVLQWTVPAVVDVVVPALPGVTDPMAVHVDSTALAAYLAGDAAVLPWPTQVWVAADDPTAAASALADVSGVRDVIATAQGASTPVTATTFTFQVAAAGAVLLALVGIAAAGLTQLGARRPEVATLRAIGVSARTQASSRVLEAALTLVPAAGLGMLSGWGVSMLVVPALAASALPAGAVLPAELHVAPGVWQVLMGVAAVIVALTVAASARTVMRQARDRTYREEVR